MNSKSPILKELIEEYGAEVVSAAVPSYGWPSGQDKLRAACDRSVCKAVARKRTGS